MKAIVYCAICGLEGTVFLMTTQTRTKVKGNYAASMKNAPTVWICDSHEM